MSLQHTIDTFEPHDAAPSRAGSERYWAPCMAVALLAISLFYVTLKDLVHESAARVPAPPPVVSAHVEATGPVDQRAAPVLPVFTPPPVRSTNASFEAQASAETPDKAVPAVTEVRKCVMPEGDVIYSDDPCPEGAHASTLRLPRDLHALANQ